MNIYIYTIYINIYVYTCVYIYLYIYEFICVYARGDSMCPLMCVCVHACVRV